MSPSRRPSSFALSSLRAPALAAMLAATAPSSAMLAGGRHAAAAAEERATATQLSGLLRQLNLRARPAPREVSRCRSSACRAATAPLVA